MGIELISRETKLGADTNICGEHRVACKFAGRASCSLVVCVSKMLTESRREAHTLLARRFSNHFPNTSIVMPSPQSEFIDPKIKAFLERQIQAWETADSDKLIADFAEDSLFIVPGSTFRGKQQIKEAAKQYFSEFTDTKVTIKRIIVNGNEGTVEWSWSDKNKTTGEESHAEDAIVFELEEGKIKYWREYIDKQAQRT